MSKFIDLTGQIFGNLTVIKRVINITSTCTKWECLCTCGNTRICTTGHLRFGKISGCGRIECNRRFIDLVGQTFGRLTVNKIAGHTKNLSLLWECKCICGGVAIASTTNLRRGNTNSCGCLCKERTGNSRRTHGKSKTIEYKAWSEMKSRCFADNGKNFKWYKGRGITIYPEWINDFNAFFKYIGKKPSPLHSIDRIDNSIGYFPGNVRWATQKTQQNNRGNNHLITFTGDTKTLAQWTKLLGLKRGALGARLARGWPIERAFSEPIRQSHIPRSSPPLSP